MSEELSEVQRDVLGKMDKGHWYSAHDLSASLASLRALERSKKVKSKSMAGAIAFPRVGILWART